MELLKWVSIDFYRRVKYGQKLHLYGIRCVSGMYGMGKTTVLSFLGVKYRNKFGDDVYISSNFGFALQDFAFTDINQISIDYDKPIIFLWDEVQNDFPATDKVFPVGVRKALTFNRKGNGKMFYWCSQDPELVHKTIRRLTIRTGDVKTYFKRWTRVKWYTQLDYMQRASQLDGEKRFKIRPVDRDSFIQTDYLRGLYSSYSSDSGEKINK